VTFPSTRVVRSAFTLNYILPYAGNSRQGACGVPSEVSQTLSSTVR